MKAYLLDAHLLLTAVAVWLGWLRGKGVQKVTDNCEVQD